MNEAAAAADRVRSQADLDYAYGIIVGEENAGIVGMVEGGRRVSTHGLPTLSSLGHDTLVVGRLEGVPVVVICGLPPFHDTSDAGMMRPAIEMLQLLGCDKVLLIAEAGAVRDTLSPGGLMIIGDHINFAGHNPLRGIADERRFVDLSETYDRGLKGALFGAALEEGVTIEDGVYALVAGPASETVAEARAIRNLGSDAIGTSIVPEVILCRYFGLRVLAIAVISHYAAGSIGDAVLHETHEEIARRAERNLERVVRKLFRDHAGA